MKTEGGRQKAEDVERGAFGVVDGDVSLTPSPSPAGRGEKSAPDVERVGEFLLGVMNWLVERERVGSGEWKVESVERGAMVREASTGAEAQMGMGAK